MTKMHVFLFDRRMNNTAITSFHIKTINGHDVLSPG